MSECKEGWVNGITGVQATQKHRARLGWAGGKRKSILEEVAWALGLEGEVIPHSVRGWKVFRGRVGRCVGVSSGAIWPVQRQEPDGGLGPKVGETWNGS